MANSIESVTLDTGSEFVDLGDPSATDRCNDILNEAKAIYFLALQEKHGEVDRDELYMKVQKHVLDTTWSHRYSLDHAVKILSALAKTVEDFHKLIKVSPKNRVQAKAEKVYFDAMKDKMLKEEISYQKVRVFHREQLLKVSNMILEESDDIDQATTCINNISAAAAAFLETIDYV